MPRVPFLAPILSVIFLTTAAGTALAQCALPNQLQSGDLADATKVAANFTALANCVDAQVPSASANAVIYNGGSGALAGVPPLTDGQLLIGSSGNPPQPGTLTAGSGIAITTGPASVTISATGSGTGAAVDWLNKAAVVKPNVGSFTMRTTTTPPAGAALAATTRGILLSVAASVNNQAVMADVPLPSGNWQATMLAVYTGPLNGYIQPSLTVRDSTTNRAVSFSQGANGGGSSYRFDYVKTSGGIGLDSNSGDTSSRDVGFSTPSEPIWSRLTYNGTTFVWSFSRDGENFTEAYSISATDWLSQLSAIGPAILFYQPDHSNWNSGYHILSWNLASL
ncbi:hypothetical protein FBZ98_11542 [Rhizobium sp. ERR 922]|uniref:hypothetical protein n=1 Tax=unclassified Rhizobium TaxID=2613769 RepID=UPI0011AD4EC6|nr:MULTISPECIES: hypothetical protein [unclassified Rhizobium]TWB45572.1 hypothetical protein FBZ98_11542 [Rhizobium sp. ERR 922]TWB88192.1 hypothetical protein FBZ97_11415 [Rhizobium sp. ERR 942]